MVQQIYRKYTGKNRSMGLFPLLIFIFINLGSIPLTAQTAVKTTVKAASKTATPTATPTAAQAVSPAATQSATQTSGQTAAVINIDNNYDDWQKIQPLATFSIDYSPVYFQQEKAGRTVTLNIEEAQYWKRAGTSLKTIKAQKAQDALYIYIESHSNFAENFSVFLYLFKARNQKEENTCTLELIPITSKKGEGLILMWKKGESKPRKCGHLVASDFQMELKLPLKELPSDFQKDFSKLSFDLSTCYQPKTAGAYEDYFFTTIYARDIR